MARGACSVPDRCCPPCATHVTVEILPPCEWSDRVGLWDSLMISRSTVRQGTHWLCEQLGRGGDLSGHTRNEAWLRSPPLCLASLLNCLLFRIMFPAVLTACTFLMQSQQHGVDGEQGRAGVCATLHCRELDRHTQADNSAKRWMAERDSKSRCL